MTRRLRALWICTLLAGCGSVEPMFIDGGGGDDDDVDAGDLTAPATSLTVAPAALSNEATARFEFTADRPATFTCRLDAEAAAPCTSPHQLPVADGPHLFEVTATSAAGVADATPAQHSWRVDTVAPDTTFDVVPPAADNSTAVTFEFHAGETASFSCGLDGGAATPCTSPHAVTGLADGPHTFVVRATDAAGNVEVAPASHAWTLDASTPDTTIDSGPSGAVAVTTASFGFSSPDAGPGATFECALDGAAFAACTSPRTASGLAEGPHTFRVRVRDVANNVDPTPAERAWTVDTIAPTVSITPPASPTNVAAPTFAFTTGGAPATIECRLDGAAFAACTTATSHTPPALADGSHSFEVRVVDLAGNSGTATASVTIDTVAPTVTITPPAADPTNDATPTFTFTTGGGVTSVQCRLGTAPFGACTTATSHTAATLADATHTFEVRVADAAGNARTASATITVDTMAPTVTIGAFASPTNDTTPTFPFTTAGGPTVVQCRMGTAAFGNCTTPTSHTPGALAQGTSTFEVRVVDAAGNVGSATATVVVDTVAPTVNISSGPTGTIFTSTATWTFTTSGGAASTGCRVYKSGFAAPAFAPCTSPATLPMPSVTSPTAMRFEVEARDAAGNAAVALWTFTLDSIN